MHTTASANLTIFSAESKNWPGLLQAYVNSMLTAKAELFPMDSHSL